jgi:HK97 family phage portal protein
MAKFADWLPRIPALARKEKASLGQIREASLLSNIGHGLDYALESYADYYFTSVPAYRAVQVRADAVGSARLIVGEEVVNEGGRTAFIPADKEHLAQSVLDGINPWFARADYWRVIETHLLLFGSAFTFIQRAQGLGPPSLWPLHPSKMTVLQGRGSNPVTGYVKGFQYDLDGTRIPLSVDEVWWLRRTNPRDEFAGMSSVAPVRLTLDMGREAVLFNRNVFKNGVNPNNIAFVVPGLVSLPEAEIEAFYKRLEQKFTGAKNAHRPLLVPGSNAAGPGVDVKTLGLTQKDMEYLASLNWTVQDAARAFGVPPPMLYAETQSKYANVHEWNGDFWRSTIMPEWDWLSAQVKERLLPLLGFPEMEAKFDFSSNLAIQESMALLRQEDRSDVQADILTINEVREARGLVPVPWGDGPSSSMGVEFDETGLPIPPEKPEAPVKSYKRYGPQVDLDLVSRAFVQRLTRYEKAFAQLQRRLFKQQAQETSRRIAEGIPPNAAFDAKMWHEPWRKAAKPIYERALGAAAQDVAGRFGLYRQVIASPPAFNLADSAVQQWLQKRLELWSVLVNEETGRLINGIIAEANELGESIPQIQARLETTFRFNDRVRTERIARTEMLSTSNQGHLSAYEQSGVVERIQWLSARDDRVRDDHRAADGQIVELGEPFKVGNDLMDAPGIGVNGTLGAPEQVINCRCVTVPVLTQRSAIVRTAALNGHAAKP